MPLKMKPGRRIKLGPCPWCQSSACIIEGGNQTERSGCQWRCEDCHARGPVAHVFNTPPDEYLHVTASERFWKAFPTKQPELKESFYFYIGWIIPAAILFITLGAAIYIAFFCPALICKIPW